MRKNDSPLIELGKLLGCQGIAAVGSNYIMCSYRSFSCAAVKMSSFICVDDLIDTHDYFT